MNKPGTFGRVMTPAHKRRSFLTPDEKAEVMAALAKGRDAAVKVTICSTIGSVEYIAAGMANDSILKLARTLTSDENALLAPLHSGGAGPKWQPPEPERS